MAQCDRVVETEIGSVCQSDTNGGWLSVTKWLKQRDAQFDRLVDSECGSV